MRRRQTQKASNGEGSMDGVSPSQPTRRSWGMGRSIVSSPSGVRVPKTEALLTLKEHV